MISADYKKQIQELQSQKKFKSALVKYPDVKNFIEKYKPTSLLDYGCAHGGLINQIKIDFPKINPLHGFDPGVPEFENIKEKSYDCIISNDVIEHFEPNVLDQTLRHMDTLFERYAWFIIACYPAKKYLSDGRNAHLVIESPEWWINKINENFINSKIIWYQILEFAPGKPEIRMILQK